MPVTITFRRVRHTQGIEEEIRTRIAALERFYPRLEFCRVQIDLPHRHHASGNHYRVRIALSVPGEDVFVLHEQSLRAQLKAAEVAAVKKGMDVAVVHRYLRRAVHDAFDTARRQLEDHARRLRGDKKARAGTRRAPLARAVSFAAASGVRRVAVNPAK